MKIVIRNITKDTMVDFNNDHVITLPMDEEKLKKRISLELHIRMDLYLCWKRILKKHSK